jgi:hypothetical protein
VPRQLAGCYRISLQLAAEHGLKHIVSFALLLKSAITGTSLRSLSLAETHTFFFFN